MLDQNIELLNLALPLAISFFTFQQIAYLVDCFRAEVKERSFINYLMFVTFFPQLIAGPIVHHREMMPQFANSENKTINVKNISLGVFIFTIGLFKKVVIADTFAVWATNGFDKLEVLTVIEAWATSLSYTFQLYFDFSGYTDMAIGAALLFNIKLPQNFNSPYKALNIQDFWRRWHITLGNFLRDYIYLPLGGNKNGKLIMYRNLFLTFLIGGVWHGAGWNFILWGTIHGLALIIHRLYLQLGFSMNAFLACFLTFNFVNISWIFFRANEWSDAIKVLRGMFGLTGFSIGTLTVLTDPILPPFSYFIAASLNVKVNLVFIGITFLVVFFGSKEKLLSIKSTPIYIFLFIAMGLLSLLNLRRVSEFLYFNF